ncbi:MAG: CapA family protein [Microcoleaceae cyanobacterium]
MSQIVDVVSLARRGNADAIADLVTKALRKQGIIAKATRREHHLYLLLESTATPDESACVRVVQNGLLRLEAQQVEFVTIVGQQVGRPAFKWTHTIRFQLPPAPAKTSIRPFQRQKPQSKAQPPQQAPSKSQTPARPAPPPPPPKPKAATPTSRPPAPKAAPAKPIPAIPLPPHPAVLMSTVEEATLSPRKIPFRALLVAGSIGLLLAPLSGWLFTQRNVGELFRTLPRSLATVPQTMGSAWSRTVGSVNLNPEILSFLEQDTTQSAPPESQAATTDTTASNLTMLSEFALSSITNPVGPDTRIKLKAVGDMIPGTNYPSNKLHPNKEVLFQSVKPALEGSDILFGNFESTLTNYPKSAKNIGRGLVFAFRTPPEYTSIFQDAGFDVLSVANNHSFDFFETGFDDTINNINKAGMKAVGRRDQIVYHEAKGVKFAFIGFSYFPVHNNMLELDQAKALVKQADANADIVVISLHAGAEGTSALRVRNRTEYFYGENRGNKVAFAHAMIDAGADLFLGHGPHVPRALELYKNKLIAYSLGNFMGYRTLSSRGKLGYSLVLEADLDPVGNFKSGKIIPIHINSKGIPYQDSKGRSIGLIRNLTQSDFPDTPLSIDGQGVISVKSE